MWHVLHIHKSKHTDAQAFVYVRKKRMEYATKRTADAQPQARNLCTLEIYDLNAAAHNQKDKRR